MALSIKEINRDNIEDVNRCNGEFTIDSRLVLRVENNVVHYTILPVPATTKRYKNHAVDYTTYIDHPDRAVYLAYVDGRVAGQLILLKNWNQFAYIEDIAVDVLYRRQGIGKQLISQAVAWARSRNLPGIMLETQDNNVAACIFYEKCGFKLNGFDTYLYKGIDPSSDEIALYWYLIFP